MSNKAEKNVYRAAIIVIGNEILSGRTKDTNTSWIAEHMVEMGIVLGEVRVVPDIEAEIIFAVNELRAKFDYVFTTGGIGPTHDDITADSIAAAFGVGMELNQEAYQILVRHYGSEAEVTPPRKKMAMIPVGASLINNPVSGAPGFQLGNVYVMAGVPKIMQAMLDDVKLRLKRGKPILSNTIACSLIESVIAEPLGKIQALYPPVSIGSYPHFRSGVLGISLVLRSAEKDVLDKATAEVIKMVADLGGEASALSIQSQGGNLGPA